MKTINKVVWITGASSGIGKATAKVMLENGYIVYAGARNKAKLEDLKTLGAHVLKMDLTDDSDLQSGIDEIIANEGRIDILINSAGFGLLGAVEDISIAQARYQLDITLFGSARAAQLVLPYMRKQKSGTIINMTFPGSKETISPLSGWYNAGKFALEALSASIAKEVEPFGINVMVTKAAGLRSEWNGIEEPLFNKEFTEKAYEGIAEKIIEFSDKAVQKQAAPELLANLILDSIRASNAPVKSKRSYFRELRLFLKSSMAQHQTNHSIATELA